MPTLTIRFRSVNNFIGEGDILLFRPTTFYGRIVAWWTKAKHGHAALAMKTRTGVTVLEIHENGYREMSIEEHLSQGAVIDVFRVDERKYDRTGAVLEMMEYGGCKYGWLHVFIVAFRFIFPFLFRRNKECSREHSPHCSQAVSKAVRVGGGIDLVPDVPDWKTAPVDLSKSDRLIYVFTLSK